MSSFSTRAESDVLVVKFETPPASTIFGTMRSATRSTSSSRPIRRRSFAVDLAKVDYLSSSGVAILVGLKRRVETQGGKIVIYHSSRSCATCSAVMKLDRFFTIADDEAAGARLLPSRPHGLIAFLRFPRYPGFPIFTGRMKAGSMRAPIERGVSASLRRQGVGGSRLGPAGSSAKRSFAQRSRSVLQSRMTIRIREGGFRGVAPIGLAERSTSRRTVASCRGGSLP